MSTRWKYYTIAPERTHHLLNGRSAYKARFKEVFKFLTPGLAAVRTETEAYHIKQDGRAAYQRRFIDAFGFYELRAAVQVDRGWHHILLDGTSLYQEYYAWCGNFRDERCVVRDFDHSYFHLQLDGTHAYEASYRYASDYHEGIAVVQRADGLHTHIQQHGREVHGCWFLGLDVFQHGLACARDERGWYHIDKAGRALYKRRFAAIEPFYNGEARVEEFTGSLLVINEQGTTLVCLRL